jgi:hypothetical protein
MPRVTGDQLARWDTTVRSCPACFRLLHELANRLAERDHTEKAGAGRLCCRCRMAKVAENSEVCLWHPWHASPTSGPLSPFC